MEQQDIREIRVGEIMETDWPTLRSESTIEEAIKLFAEARISGAPVVEGASVSARVDTHFRGEKIVVFKYKAKKRYRRRTGHRQSQTYITITGITG